VTFAPNPRYGTGMTPVVRTILFWVLMMGLAVVLWRMSSRSPKDSDSNQQISYSDFLQQADKNNIATATFALSQSTADVSGALRDPVEAYRTTVPRESVSDLTDRLRKQGVNVSVSELPNQTWKTYLANFAPLLLLVGFWVFMMQRMRARQMPPPNSPNATTPSNTPL
jgi:cell division protease FtsH